jgi:hypothetical protein
MLKKWLGEEAFNAAMGKAPPTPAPAPAEPPAATAKAPPSGGAPAPPLVLIREGVAAQKPGYKSRGK